MDERQLVCYPRSGTCALRNSYFACDVIAAMFVYNNNSVEITFFCCIHQHVRHTLCHLNPLRLSANQEYGLFFLITSFPLSNPSPIPLITTKIRSAPPFTNLSLFLSCIFIFIILDLF